jgi:hypothetical protein
MRQSDAYLPAARLLISSYFLLSLAKYGHEIAKVWSTIRRQNVVVCVAEIFANGANRDSVALIVVLIESTRCTRWAAPESMHRKFCQSRSML